MEMNMRDWMIVIGVLLFLLVVLDGYRRALRERKNQVRMNRKAEKQRFADPEPSLSELPNGGNKRLVSTQSSHSFVESDDDLNDPLFHNPFERAQHQSAADNASIEEDIGQITQPEAQAEELLQINNEDVLLTDLAEDMQAHNEESVVLDNLQDQTDELDGQLTSLDEPSEQSMAFSPNDGSESLSYTSFDELILMHVFAQAKSGFKQSDVMDILQQCDLRLSAASIYERFEQINGQGAVQFRVANATQSGQFTVNEDNSLSGVTLFMQLPEPEQAIEAFEAMVAVAQCLADNLGGVVKDGNYSTMTEQTLQHSRQQIKDYLQQQLVKHG